MGQVTTSTCDRCLVKETHNAFSQPKNMDYVRLAIMCTRGDNYPVTRLICRDCGDELLGFFKIAPVLRGGTGASLPPILDEDEE